MLPQAGKPFKRFADVLAITTTWLKPGVNETAMLITGSQLTITLHFKLESANVK
jgi:hypothetical protein